MKKFILFLTIVLFAFLFTTSHVLALEEYEGEVEGAATPAAQAKKVNYDLPYPGILPDSPLWVVKDLRDKFFGLIIFDPVAKGHYNLKLADKRLAAGIALIDGGKKELGVKTFISAEKYLAKAVSEELTAKSKGQDTATLDGQLSVASTKHLEILSEKLVESQNNVLLEEAIGVASDVYNRVKKVFEDKLINFVR